MQWLIVPAVALVAWFFLRGGSGAPAGPGQAQTVTYLRLPGSGAQIGPPPPPPPDLFPPPPPPDTVARIRAAEKQQSGGANHFN